MSELITLNSTTPSVQYLCKKDKRLAKVISMVGEITYEPHEDDPYRFLVHEIIEQMLSIKSGEKIFGRLVDLCGGELVPEKVDKLSEEQIRSTGTSNPKVKYILGVTNSVISGELNFKELKTMTDAEVTKRIKDRCQALVDLSRLTGGGAVACAMRSSKN